MSDIDRNSADYWFPLLPGSLDAMTPHTRFVPYNHFDAMAAIEDSTEWPEWSGLLDRVMEAITDVGGTAFIRTDLASAKHDGPKAYKAEVPYHVADILTTTTQDNEVKFWPHGPFPRAFLVREFLELDAPFRAFNGHPIAREWRYFATADNVVCRHFYWPEHAILTPDRANWRELRAALESEPPPDELADAAVVAAAACPKATTWSVDFARDVHGHWWLIDMADAETSWHPGHDCDLLAQHVPGAADEEAV